MYIPKQWLVPFALSFVLALAAVWLISQNQALGARVDALESSEADVTEIRSMLSEPVSHSVPAGTAPRAVSLDVSQLPEICTELGQAQGTGAAPAGFFDAGEDGGSGGGGGGGGDQNTVEKYNEVGNFATNSGSILDSFFLDGGQGDVGINIYKSVLTGVNFSTSHLGGSNSKMTESGNTESAAVTGNTPTNVHAPTYDIDSIVASTDVASSIGPDNTVAGKSKTGDASSVGTNTNVSPSGTTSTSAATPTETSAPTSSEEDGSGG